MRLSTLALACALLVPAARSQCTYPCGPAHQVGVLDFVPSCNAGLNCDTGAALSAFQAKLRLELQTPLTQGGGNAWVLRICGPSSATITVNAPVAISIEGAPISPFQLSGYPSACDLTTPFTASTFYATVWPFQGVCCGGSTVIPWPFPIPPGFTGVPIFSQALVLDAGRLVLSQTIRQTVQ